LTVNVVSGQPGTVSVGVTSSPQIITATASIPKEQPQQQVQQDVVPLDLPGVPTA